jgi:hypothetical protein
VYHKESYKIVNKTQEKEDVKELTKENFSWFLGNKRERKNKCDPKGRTFVFLASFYGCFVTFRDL